MRRIVWLLVAPALACAAPPVDDPSLDSAGDAPLPELPCRETTFDADDAVTGAWRFALDVDARERVGLHGPGAGPGVDMEQRETFDAAWRPQRRTLDFAADGTVDHVEQTTRDDEGRPVLVTVAYDDEGVAAWTTAFTYDDDGLLVRTDETSRTGDLSVRTFENDAHGNALMTATDQDGDGVVDFVRRDAWTYDDADRPVRLDFGVNDEGTAVETTTWAYDDDDHVASVAVDSTLDGASLTTFAYDGHRLVEVATVYSLAGGAPAQRTTYAYTCP